MDTIRKSLIILGEAVARCLGGETAFMKVLRFPFILVAVPFILAFSFAFLSLDDWKFKKSTHLSPSLRSSPARKGWPQIVFRLLTAPWVGDLEETYSDLIDGGLGRKHARRWLLAKLIQNLPGAIRLAIGWIQRDSKRIQPDPATSNVVVGADPAQIFFSHSSHHDAATTIATLLGEPEIKSILVLDDLDSQDSAPSVRAPKSDSSES
jgi:hypothetical protein